MNADIIFLIQLILVVILILVLFNILLTRLHKYSLKRMEQKVPTLTDKKLLKHYKNLDKQRKNKFFAFYTSGIFYKKTLNMYEENFQVYKTEVEKRELNQKGV